MEFCGFEDFESLSPLGCGPNLASLVFLFNIWACGYLSVFVIVFFVLFFFINFVGVFIDFSMRVFN